MRNLLLPLLTILASTLAHAGPSIRIVKMEPIAASGVCTPAADIGKAEAAMHRFDLNILNGNDKNDIALGRGLLQLERLSGGRFRPGEGATFKILKEKGCAQQLGQTIVLRQGCGSLTSVAYYIHELGHYIGNNDGGKLYREYKSTIRSRCAVSRYSMKDWTKARARNEEFAEVIAAFVTNPSLLLNAGPNCVKAYNYFRDKVFDNGNLAVCKASSKVAKGQIKDISADNYPESFETCSEATLPTNHELEHDLEHKEEVQEQVNP